MRTDHRPARRLTDRRARHRARPSVRSPLGSELMLLTVADDPRHGGPVRTSKGSAAALMEGDQAPGGRMPDGRDRGGRRLVAGGSDRPHRARHARRRGLHVHARSQRHQHDRPGQRGRHGRPCGRGGPCCSSDPTTSSVPACAIRPTWWCASTSPTSSHGVVDPAVDVALELRAEITVVRVLEPILALVPSPLPSQPTEPEIPALEAVAKEVANRGVPAAYALLEARQRGDRDRPLRPRGHRHGLHRVGDACPHRPRPRRPRQRGAARAYATHRARCSCTGPSCTGSGPRREHGSSAHHATRLGCARRVPGVWRDAAGRGVGRREHELLLQPAARSAGTWSSAGSPGSSHGPARAAGCASGARRVGRTRRPVRVRCSRPTPPHP